MPDADEYSDDAVANALKRDAHASAIKYSTLGLQAFLPKRPTGAAPKPNTRFLRNILRETDSHNAALLAKEKREAKERQRALTRSEPGRLSPFHEDRRAAPQDDPLDARRKRRREATSRSRSRSRSPRRVKRRDADDKRGEKKRRKRHRSRSPGSQSHSDRSVERSRDKYSGKRSRDERPRDDQRSRHRRRRYRSRSESRSRAKHGRHKDKNQTRRSSRSSDSTTPQPTRNRSQPEASDEKLKSSNRTAMRSESNSDSDPLDAIIGPAPPPPEPKVKAKGRGAFNSSSAAMDAHFSSNYDPTVDVQPDPETEDDWEQALEALRDRQKWRQQGADRLRSAGFSETEVKKWEKGDAKDESDVTWAKKGEGREWDRGKVVGDETIDLKPSWS